MMSNPLEQPKESFIEEFAKSDEYTELQDHLREHFEKSGRKYADYEEAKASGVHGAIFEAMYLYNYYKENQTTPEFKCLSEFLKAELGNTQLHQVGVYKMDRPNLTEDPKNKKGNPAFVEPDNDDLIDTIGIGVAGSNPDILLFEVKEDQKTGHQVALITGMQEVKINSSKGNYKDDRIQVERSQGNVRTLVQNLKPRYAKLMKELGIDDIMPDDIDIVPPKEFKVSVVMPAEHQGTSKFGKELIKAPFSTDDVKAMYERLDASI